MSKSFIFSIIAFFAVVTGIAVAIALYLNCKKCDDYDFDEIDFDDEDLDMDYIDEMEDNSQSVADKSAE